MSDRVVLPTITVGTVSEVEAGTPDRRSVLVAMRALLAERLEVAPHSAVAQIARELRAVLAELDALGEERPSSSLDELLARREARRGESA